MMGKALRRTAKTQQGMSMLAILLLVGVVGFFLTVLFKVGPLYMDNYFISAAMDDLKSVDLHNMTKSDIHSRLSNSFSVNNVRGVDMKKVKVTKNKSNTTVDLDYDKQVNFMGNVDVVVKFKNHIDSAK